MRLSLKSGCLGSLVLLTIILSGCSKKIETKEVYSPDREFILRTEIDESGGAPVADVTSVYLRLSSSSSRHGQLVFKGSAMGEFNAAWEQASLIRLSYTGGYVFTCMPTAELAPDKKVSVLGCK